MNLSKTTATVEVDSRGDAEISPRMPPKAVSLQKLKTVHLRRGAIFSKL